MEPKVCGSIGCWTQVGTLNWDLTHALTLDFQGQIFNFVLFQEWDG